MTKCRQRIQDEQSQDDKQSQARRGDKVQQAQEKLARMEYPQAERDHILEPKGPKNIPGFSFNEMEAQRQFVHRLSTCSVPAEDHAAGVEESQRQDSEIVR